MALIEVCDICRKEVDNTDGITIECADWNGLEFVAGVHPSRSKRKYKIRICDRCKANVIKYCKQNIK